MASKKGNSRSARKKQVEIDVTDSIFPLQQEVPLRHPVWNQKQKDTVEKILDRDTKITILAGKAGTGKTTIALYCAVSMLREKQINKIVYLRSPTEACSSKIGFLPGLEGDKMMPYAQCGENVISDLTSKSELAMMKANGTFSVMPINFLRGLSFHNTFLILEEASDLNLKELEMVAGRYGKNSKFVIIGDERQSNAKSSGFSAMTNMFDDQESRNRGIFVVRFETSDCVRSPLTRFILEKFEKLNP